MDPLIEKVDSAFANFTNSMDWAVNLDDCTRRLGVGDPVREAGSLMKVIEDGIFSMNTDIVGIVFAVDVIPYFNFETLSVGLIVKLSATFEQTAAELLGLVSDYVTFSTDPSSDSSTSKLGLGHSGNAPVFDFEDLLSKVALAAGLDITFGIDINLAEIHDGIFESSYPLAEGLRKGCSLFIDTWGAFVEVIVDPIDLSFSLFGKDVLIRDSHFVTALYIRSRGRFFASIDDMIVGGSALDTSPLMPEFTVPLSAELIFDIPVNDQINISPILSAESENLLNSRFLFDFDLDVDTFLNNDYVGENTVLEVLQSATAILQAISNLQPEVKVADGTPSALDGFFSVVTQLGDLGEEFVTYMDMVNQGMCWKNMSVCYDFCFSLSSFGHIISILCVKCKP